MIRAFILVAFSVVIWLSNAAGTSISHGLVRSVALSIIVPEGYSWSGLPSSFRVVMRVMSIHAVSITAAEESESPIMIAPASCAKRAKVSHAFPAPWMIICFPWSVCCVAAR